MYQFEGSPSEAEAAAIAAVISLLEAEAAQVAVEHAKSSNRWCDAARLVIQGLTPIRTPVSPRWGRIERLRRAGRPATGITGQ